jgi:TolA-binding protein
MTSRRVRPRRSARGVLSLTAAKAQLTAARHRIQALTAKLAAVDKARAAEVRATRSRLTRARREFEQQLTRMVQEIGELRHHEARCKMLEQTLAAREEELKRLSARNAV